MDDLGGSYRFWGFWRHFKSEVSLYRLDQLNLHESPKPCAHDWEVLSLLGGFGAIHESYGLPFHGALYASIGNCSYGLLLGYQGLLYCTLGNLEMCGDYTGIRLNGPSESELLCHGHRCQDCQTWLPSSR